MKTLTISIPTNMADVKDFLTNKFEWLTHRGRMRKNNTLLNNLYRELCNEINSGYWSEDISDYMKKELTRDGGKIQQVISNVKRKMV